MDGTINRDAPHTFYTSILIFVNDTVCPRSFTLLPCGYLGYIKQHVCQLYKAPIILNGLHCSIQNMGDSCDIFHYTNDTAEKNICIQCIEKMNVALAWAVIALGTISIVLSAIIAVSILLYLNAEDQSTNLMTSKKRYLLKQHVRISI